MTITINGSGTITGVSAGGLPSGTVTQATLATPVAGTGPAFSAYKSADQTITSTVITKVTFDTEIFDTNSNFASSTFTPTVAGYYQVNATVAIQTSLTITYIRAAIYKNGSPYKYIITTSTSVNVELSGSDLIYMNGTTDYLEIYARGDGTGTLAVISGSTNSSFSAFLARSA